MRSYSSRSTRALSYFGILCTLFGLRASASCYYPNGTADNTNTFRPCKSTGQSMCCQTNTSTISAANVDTCNAVGLCIPDDNNGVWRKLCTDRTWKDPACLNLCTTGDSVDGKGILNANASVPLTTCGDTSLCCGNINQNPGQDCCSRRKGLFIQDGKLVSTTTATATPAATSSTTSSASAAAKSSSSSSSSSNTKSASSNTGAIVGGVVGGIAGIVFLAFAFWYFMIRRNVQQQSRPSQSYEPYQTGKDHTWQDPREASTYASGARRGELDATEPTTTQELEGWQVKAHGSPREH